MIIGITGLAGSGKDSAARFIMEAYPTYQKLSFASKLKDMVATLYGWDRNKLEGITVEDRAWREKPDITLSNTFERKISPRHELQLLGTGLKDILQKNFWACIVKHEIQSKKLKDVVITDVRFPDEIQMIRDLHGYIIEIDRGETPDWFDVAWKINTGRFSWLDKIKRYSEYKSYLKQHASEKSWIGINEPDDIIVNPEGDLGYLKSEVLKIMLDVQEYEKLPFNGDIDRTISRLVK